MPAGHGHVGGGRWCRWQVVVWSAGFLVASDLQPGWERGAQEVAGGMPVAGDQSGFVTRPERLWDRTADGDFVMDVGDGQMPAAGQHPGELGHHRCERRHVSQGKAGHDEVNGAVGQWEPAEIAEDELARRYAGAGPGKHVG
jgi:hypothetical protein